jgi:hypothetical protein
MGGNNGALFIFFFKKARGIVCRRKKQAVGAKATLGDARALPFLAVVFFF